MPVVICWLILLLWPFCFFYIIQTEIQPLPVEFDFTEIVMWRLLMLETKNANGFKRAMFLKELHAQIGVMEIPNGPLSWSIKKISTTLTEKANFEKMYSSQRHLFCLQLLVFTPAIDFVLSYICHYERRRYLFCRPNQAWLGWAISAVMKSIFQARSTMVRNACPPAPSSKRHFLLSLKSVNIYMALKFKSSISNCPPELGMEYFCLEAYRLWPGVSCNCSETFLKKPWSSCVVWTNIWYETGVWWLRATFAAMLEERNNIFTDHPAFSTFCFRVINQCRLFLRVAMT